MKSAAARAFEVLADGAEPLDLVREYGFEIEEARQYCDAYEDLADAQMLDTEDIDSIREQAAAEATEELEKRNQELQEAVARLQQDALEEYQVGVREGEEIGREDALAECERRVEAVRRQLEQQQSERLGELEDQLESTRRARAAARRAGYAEAVHDAEAEAFANAYLEGFRHGILTGARAGHGAGAVDAARRLAGVAGRS